MLLFCCLFRAATSTDVPKDPVHRAALRSRKFPPRVAVSSPLPSQNALLPSPSAPGSTTLRSSPSGGAVTSSRLPPPSSPGTAQAPCCARRLTEPPEEVKLRTSRAEVAGPPSGLAPGPGRLQVLQVPLSFSLPTRWLQKVAVVFPVLLEAGSSSLNPRFYLSARDGRLQRGVEGVEKGTGPAG